MKNIKLKTLALCLAMVIVLTGLITANAFEVIGGCTCGGVYDNGFCSSCGGYQPATLTEDKYDLNGDEAKDSVYEIENAGQLCWFANLVNGGEYGANAVLTQNISVNTADWIPIGSGEWHYDYGETPDGGWYDNSWQEYYDGYFDGQNHTISGLKFNDVNTDHDVGLFGCIRSNAVVKNVGVLNCNFVGGYYVGGVVGHSYGTVSNCYVTGSVVGNGNIGGVVGYNYNGTISDCHNGASVGYRRGSSGSSSEGNVGGVVGSNSGGTVTNCYNTGSFGGPESSGGVVGSNYHGTVSNCYNTGSFNTSNGDDAGGVVGHNRGTVTNCYNTGTISGGSYDYVGGVVCKNEEEGVVENCENRGAVRGYSYTGGIVAVNGGILKNCHNKYNVVGTYQYNWGSGNAGGVVCRNTGTVTNCSNIAGVTGYGYTGGVAWQNTGTMTNCFNTGTVSATSSSAAGVVYDNNGTVTNCYNTGNVSGSRLAAGVVTYNDGTVTNCYNTGNVSGSSYAGGVITYNKSVVDRCYNTGKVTSSGYAGGVAAYNDAYSIITNCYSQGEVRGTNFAGGVVGANYNVIINCYNTGAVSGNGSVGGVAGDHENGYVINCYYLEGSTASNAGKGTAKSAEDFGTGVVTLMLGSAYGQDVKQSEEDQEYDPYPVFRTDNNTVYGSGPCAAPVVNENPNDPSLGDRIEHNYNDKGLCACGTTSYEQPQWDDVDECWLITNAGELYWFANYVNSGNTDANAKLGANIVVNEDVLAEGLRNPNADIVIVWSSIGNENVIYTGEFDGQGFTISGLYGCAGKSSYFGLFGHIGENAVVENVHVEDSFFYGLDYVGGIVGYNDGGTVADCSNRSSVVAFADTDMNGGDGRGTGGVVGYNAGTVTNCCNDGKITGRNSGGGVVGINEGTVDGCVNRGTVYAANSTDSGNSGGVVASNSGTVINCYNEGFVDGANSGGVACSNSGTVENCYNTGHVDSWWASGGVVGYNRGTVNRCYNTGMVEASQGYAGGVVGYNYGAVSNCYNMGDIIGDYSVGGIVAYNSKTSDYNTGVVYSGTVVNCYNAGIVTGDYASGVVGREETYNEDAVKNCYYLEGTASGGISSSNLVGQAESKTLEQFKSGEVTYLLNGDQTNIVFYQTIGTDDFPVFSKNSLQVYAYALCPLKLDGYTNDPENRGNPTEHTYENNICIYCGMLQPPAQDEDGYYIITNVGELYWFADYVNNKGHYDANAKLGNDIIVNIGVLDEDGYLNEGEFRTWEPIGSGQWHSDEGEDENGNWYYNEWQDIYVGHFNGQGFTIYGLYCNKQSTSNIGLFGYIGSEAKVENVNVADSYFYGYHYVGGIVGYNDGGTVNNCSGDNYVRAAAVYNYYDEWDYYIEYGFYTGGIVGYNYGIVKNCSNSGMVRGYTNVGGVVGRNYGTVECCSNSAYVRGASDEIDSEYVGGVVGNNQGTVKNCFNSGTIDADGYRVGGVVGYNDGTVENCYNRGTVYGWSEVGAVVGYSDGTVTNCYYLEGCAEEDNEYGTPKTEAEFASGEVMLLLGEAFGQDLSKGEKWPTLGGPRYTMIVVFTNGEEIYYADLAEAVAAAKEDAGCTLIMLADSFKGEALINAGNFNLEFRGNQMNSTLVVAENANITIKNGKFTNITAQNGGQITINGENVTLAGVLKAEEGEITIIEAAVEAGLKLEGITLNEILDRNSFGRNEDGEVTTAVTKIRVIRPGADLSEMNITVDNVAHTGEEVTPVVVITIGGKTLLLDEDFVIAALANNKDLGINTAEVTIRAIAPYTGEKTVKFSIVNCATDFGAQIKELEERLKALEDSNELSDAIKAEIEAIYAELEQIQSNYATIEELEAAIARIDALEAFIEALENRVTANESAIEELRQQLAQVKEDVMNALNSGNADLAEQIQKLKTVLNMAIAANGAADAEMEAELQVLIREAKATLQTTIDKVAADLEQAKLDVNAAILAGDADLAQKIAELQKAMDTATAVSNAADNALKAELADAVATMHAAIAQLQVEIDNTQNKWNTLAIIAITLASVGVAGGAGLLIFVIVDKRKLAR